jgi:hypothetical protein
MEKYNGWTNYATWRINLEIFDGMDIAEYMGAEADTNPYDLAARLKEFAENIITDHDTRDGLAVDYARAFLSDVDWHDIAKHYISELEPVD